MQSLGENSYCVIDNAFDFSFIRDLKSEMLMLHEQGLFAPAKIGNQSGLQLKPDIRNDEILWVDETLGPKSKELLTRLSLLKLKLREELHLSLSNFEVHYAHYKAGGFYEKHIDQPKNLNHIQTKRLISFIVYLNENRLQQDGGELSLFLEKQIQIEPLFNRLVMFRSDIVEHRVEVCRTDRWSVCGWMRSGPQIY